ncbi:hypothetical protein QCD61_28210 (plasmid) [Pseudomonas viciae]|uniref:Uncharacterized protein n=1 Tax=Pseudomonas viciae TaxID=2505979 RepID=A0ABY8PMQ8_9PSED|nr:hypothetical protein [Pseudomonas viciae]WGO96449.1 hypothetical protein QCD61_28210 [Pseudomonas viciae]
MKPIFAAALFLVASVAQAEEVVPNLRVPPGGEVACLPFPTIKALNRDTMYKDGKPVSTSRVTCIVIDNQALPKHSEFIGHQTAGPVPNSYTFVWDQLKFPHGFLVRADNGQSPLSTTEDDSGTLKITFENGLEMSLAGELGEMLQP